MSTGGDRAQPTTPDCPICGLSDNRCKIMRDGTVQCWGEPLDPDTPGWRRGPTMDGMATVYYPAEPATKARPSEPPQAAPAAEPKPEPEAVAVGPVVMKLSDVQPEPVNWLWPGRIPLGKLTLVAGDPGLGKSLLTLDMVARVSSGTSFPDCESATNPPSGVVLLSAEDDPADTIRPRLDAARANVGRIALLQAVRIPDSNSGGVRLASFNLAIDLPALETAIDSVEGCRLIVVDPLSAYLGRTDSHVNAEVRSVLAPLAELASRRAVAVVAVTHLNKSEAQALYRAMGSLAFVAAARAAWAVCLDKDDSTCERRLFLPMKNNLAPHQTGLAFTLQGAPNGAPIVAWDPRPIDTSADDALAPQHHRRGPEPEERNRAESWLRDALAGGPRPARELLDEANNGIGLHKRTIDRAREEIGIIAYRLAVPGPWLWRLPDENPNAAPTREQPGNLGILAENTEETGLPLTPNCKDAKLSECGNLESGPGQAPQDSAGWSDDDRPPDDVLAEYPEVFRNSDTETGEE